MLVVNECYFRREMIDYLTLKDQIRHRPDVNYCSDKSEGAHRTEPFNKPKLIHNFMSEPICQI